MPRTYPQETHCMLEIAENGGWNNNFLNKGPRFVEINGLHDKD